MYKAHYAAYNWLPGSEGCAFMCDCTGSYITALNPPMLYNIAKDPAEKSPLNTSLPEHQSILGVIQKAIDEHKKSIEPVISQYAPHRLFPLPWLQPCCNFPKCRCRDKYHSDT